MVRPDRYRPNLPEQVGIDHIAYVDLAPACAQIIARFGWVALDTAIGVITDGDIVIDFRAALAELIKPGIDITSRLTDSLRDFSQSHVLCGCTSTGATNRL